MREANEIQVDRPKVVEPIEDEAERTWYGIDGPRRRPRTEVSAPPPSVVTPSPSGDADVVRADAAVRILPPAQHVPFAIGLVNQRRRKERPL